MALPDRFPWYSLVFLCFLGACGDDAPPTEDGGVLCATDDECDDGVYCNGAERCMPEDPASDGSGCMPGEPPCPEGMTCDEEAMSCDGECSTPDADEDGHDDVRCGGNDCDDADPNRFPGNTEVCDVDDHDEDCDPETYGFRDADEDGVADARCCNTVDGSTTCGTDCDDMAPGVNPTATESCDTLDNDCDGDTDEGVRTTCYTDADRDGFAPMDAAATDTCGCADGTTSVAPDGDDVDCDDSSSSRSPSVTEECNGVDDDCDTAIDEDLITVTRYVDTDGDGYAGDPVARCEGDPGSEATSSDCDESRTDSYVGAPELCDGIDNDCSSGGGTDLGEDMDGDEHAPTGSSCTGGPFPADDCDDADGSAYLGAAETCDGADDDCDGDVDERATTDAVCDGAITPGTAICLGGDCHVASCPPGTDDCNGDLSDGCETDVYASSDHCGRCGSVCLGACVSGRCTVRATQIDAGYGHTCAVLDDGQLTCWGEGTALMPNPSLVPTLVGLGDVRSIAVGRNFRCAVTTDDEVWCWGGNYNGQCGIGMVSTEVSTPTSLMGSAGEVAMTFADYRHACALETDGTARCWGHNRFDQLGDQVTDHMESCASDDCSSTPVDVLELSGIVDVGLGYGHACFMLGDGTVECLGDGAYGVFGDGTSTDRPNPLPVTGLANATQLSTGHRHNCVLLDDATVQCWGENIEGQIGNTSVGQSTDEPVFVEGLADVSSVAAGWDTSGAILNDGTVRTWGYNFYGQIGDGTNTNRDTPVVAIDARDAAELAPSGVATCMLRVDGSVACWGGGGALGDGTDTRRSYSAPAKHLNEPVALTVSWNAACGLRASGDAWCWGGNTWGYVGNGEFGDPNPLDNNVRFPQQVVDVDDFVAIDAQSVTCGIRADGTLWCWGLNGSHGRLGTGTTGGAVNRPQQVPGLTGIVALDIHLHVCAVHASGEVSCWADNDQGQVGGGSDPQTSPFTVPGVTDAVDVATAGDSSCALLADGSTDCWGGATATLAEGFTGLRTLEAGHAHYCGIRVDGQVLCVGDNSDGQIGDGDEGTTVSVPHPVAGMTNARDLSLGEAHSCALLTDGTVWCWGDNRREQLGSGIADAPTPQQVPGITDAVALAAGAETTCIRHADGRHTCWGAGSAGQLGHGETVTSSPPVRAIWH